MSPEVSSSVRRHAADQLGVAPDATPADVRAAFLRRLPPVGFLPAPPLCAAVAALTVETVPGAAGAVADDDDSDLRSAVTEFSQEFWSLPPQIRRARWSGLLAACGADPLLTDRVRRLEAGVDLPDAIDRATSPRQRQLVGMTQKLFVLGPIDRASRRRELLDSLPPPNRAWETAAREIARDFPAHAALEPALIERLSNWTHRVAAPAATAHRPAPTWGFQTTGGLQMPQVRPSKRRSNRLGMSGVGIFLLISFVVRALASLGSGPATAPRFGRIPNLPPITRYSTPQFFRPASKDNDAPSPIPEHQKPDASNLGKDLRKFLNREIQRPESPSEPRRP